MMTQALCYVALLWYIHMEGKEKSRRNSSEVWLPVNVKHQALPTGPGDPLSVWVNTGIPKYLVTS